jgi:hypothetical protein
MRVPLLLQADILFPPGLPLAGAAPGAGGLSGLFRMPPAARRLFGTD